MEALPELRTDRLLLRPFRSDDVDDVFAYACDPEWGRFLPLPKPYTRRNAEEFVAGCILVDGETRFEWAIVHEGRVSGGISLRVQRPGVAEMGYSIARALWGRGLTTEAARAVIKHAFDELGLVHVHAYADVRNEASWRVMEKLGMERVGVAHGDRLVRGERVDSVSYEILNEGTPPPAEQSAQHPAPTSPPELRTDRLLLRPFGLDDVDDVFAFAQDSEWGRYLEVPYPYTRRDAEEFVAKATVPHTGDKMRWAIVHEGRVSGFLNLTVESPDAAEVGYGIARALWGRGLVIEAVTAAITHGFESLGLSRIYAHAAVENEASFRVMEKLGMQREGVLRSHRLIHGEYVDDVLYAILREEWSPPA